MERKHGKENSSVKLVEELLRLKEITIEQTKSLEAASEMLKASFKSLNDMVYDMKKACAQSICFSTSVWRSNKICLKNRYIFCSQSQQF
jgi:hypothetical protein